MSPLRKTALVAGALYLITFATSIPARVLFAPVRNDPKYILGPGLADTQILFAGLLDVLLAFACIGTAIALYPVVKRQNQGDRAWIRRLPDPGSHHHRDRHRRPAVRDHAAAGRGRSRRAGRQPGPGRRLQLDVPVRTRLHGMCERPAAGLAAVPVRPGAPNHSAGGPDRSACAVRLRSRGPVRSLDAGFLARGDRHRADRTVGDLPRRLAGRQGLQALPDHRRNDHRKHPADLPERRSLTIKNNGGPTLRPAAVHPDHTLHLSLV